MTENGMVTIPNNVKMSITEIADLFGIYYRTAKKLIRDIEKSGVIRGDDSTGGTVEGRKVHPDYYGLEMIIVLAFRVQSRNAQMFREWLCKKAVRKEIPEMQVVPVQNYMLN